MLIVEIFVVLLKNLIYSQKKLDFIFTKTGAFIKNKASM